MRAKSGYRALATFWKNSTLLTTYRRSKSVPLIPRLRLRVYHSARFIIEWRWSMTYVVTESCIRCKYTDCVEVCPVDCFQEGPTFLVIDPDECIDCTLF